MGVAMPLVKPALAALAIFVFLGNWTAFYNMAYIQGGCVLGDQDWIDLGVIGVSKRDLVDPGFHPDHAVVDSRCLLEPVDETLGRDFAAERTPECVPVLRNDWLGIHRDYLLPLRLGREHLLDQRGIPGPQFGVSFQTIRFRDSFFSRM